MKQESKAIKFTHWASRSNLGDKMRTQLERIEKLSTTLKKWNLPYDVQGIFDRVKKGAEFERNNAMAEVENYIKKTNAPEFLREGMREKAYDSINAEMVSELESALGGIDAALKPEDLEFTGERWSFTEDYLQRAEKEIEQTLDGKRLEDFPKMQQLLDIWAELNLRYNLPEMTKFIGTQRKSPEEIAVSMLDNPRVDPYKECINRLKNK